MANAPLGDGMAGDIGVIWGKPEEIYFWARGWTGQIMLNLLANRQFSRTQALNV
jgi:hypothetical protein